MVNHDYAFSSQDMVPVILPNLDERLDRERAALLEGDLEGISRSLREKERLIDALNGLQLAPDVGLSTIREK